MEYAAVKDAMKSCPGLTELDDATLAELLWIAKDKTLLRGRTLYKQGEAADGSFCILVAGSLNVFVDGQMVADVWPPLLLGESAFATTAHTRGATLQVSSDSATILEVRPSEDLLGRLSKMFSEMAWDRWLMVTRLAPS